MWVHEYGTGGLSEGNGWSGSYLFDNDPTTLTEYVLGTTALTALQPFYGRPGKARYDLSSKQLKMVVIWNGPDPDCNISSYIVGVTAYSSSSSFDYFQVFSGLSTAANVVNVLNVTDIPSGYGYWQIFPNANTAWLGNKYANWKCYGVNFYSFSDADKISYIVSDEV